MYKNKKIGVVVPAYNEEKFIGRVIDTMPDLVDKIYVVNDASTDKTAEKVLDMARNNGRVSLVNRNSNGGVGAAIITGHKSALNDGMDVSVVMAGDGQMPPSFLTHIIEPVVDGKADYTKGNRMSSAADRQEMPRFRMFGTLLLTMLTRIASGYWHINDPQNGYTAISRDALFKLNLDSIYRGFAFENDMLIRLNLVGARVADVPHSAIYRGQTSKIKYPKFIVKTSWMLLKSWIWRLWMKYIKHPVSGKDKVLGVKENA